MLGRRACHAIWSDADQRSSTRQRSARQRSARQRSARQRSARHCDSDDDYDDATDAQHAAAPSVGGM